MWKLSQHAYIVSHGIIGFVNDLSCVDEIHFLLFINATTTITGNKIRITELFFFCHFWPFGTDEIIEEKYVKYIYKICMFHFWYVIGVSKRWGEHIFTKEPVHNVRPWNINNETFNPYLNKQRNNGRELWLKMTTGYLPH